MAGTQTHTRAFAMPIAQASSHFWPCSPTMGETPVEKTRGDQMTRPLPKQAKPVAASRTVATHILHHEDINGSNRLFGGRLMAWIDNAAGIAARRHSGTEITTACVDTLEFKNPAYLNDIVVIEASVTRVGRTSMEVMVDSYVEKPETGERLLINHAYLTEVCVDDEGQPIEVPYGLLLGTDAERAENACAERRAQLHRQRRAEGV